MTLFESFMSDSFDIIIPNVNDFNLSMEFLQKYETQLRAGDALHLAIAKNRRATCFYTLDKKLISAAKLLGISAKGF